MRPTHVLPENDPRRVEHPGQKSSCHSCFTIVPVLFWAFLIFLICLQGNDLRKGENPGQMVHFIDCLLFLLRCLYCLHFIPFAIATIYII